MRSWLRRGAAAALTVSLAGCYTVSPADPGQLDADTEVRLELTPEGADAVGDQRGTADVMVLDGLLVGRTADELLVSVPRRGQASMARYGGFRDTLRVPAAQVEQVQTRSLDAAKTGILTGGLVAGFFFVFRAIAGTGGGGGSGGELPGPNRDAGVPHR